MKKILFIFACLALIAACSQQKQPMYFGRTATFEIIEFAEDPEVMKWAKVGDTIVIPVNGEPTVIIYKGEVE